MQCGQLARGDGLSIGKYLPKFCDFCRCADGVPPHFVAVLVLAACCILVFLMAPQHSRFTPKHFCYVRITWTVSVHTPSVLPKWKAIWTQQDCSPFPGQPGHQLTVAPGVWDGAEGVCPGPMLQELGAHLPVRWHWPVTNHPSWRVSNMFHYPELGKTTLDQGYAQRGSPWTPSVCTDV